MAGDTGLGNGTPAAVLAAAGEALVPPTTQPGTGKSVPDHGNTAPGGVASGHTVRASVPAARAVAAAPRRPEAVDIRTAVAQLNKFLNDSGRPNQYRVDQSTGTVLIQEINPANGKLLAEFPVAEFPALARGLGASGILVNEHV